MDSYMSMQWAWEAYCRKHGLTRGGRGLSSLYEPVAPWFREAWEENERKKALQELEGTSSDTEELKSSSLAPQQEPSTLAAPTVSNNIHGNYNQVTFAQNGAIVTATQNNGYNLAELQPLIDRILQSIPDNTPQETVGQVRENLQFIQTEVQSPAPRRNIMKTVLTGLVNGTIQATGFLANLATLAQFLGI